ncbi:ParB/RepB/Spo0J family partition protein [Rhodococcoides yunnanense]|jgi:ParB/RepB/Spo0J family partition protein|uniref:ParB/RepB/Spo0J family partition protein n=1 Tax=Rhodococcoides yunnanense TaxID=278209 RepID=UPI0022B1892A|nr:peptide transporter [Rhodococcus yunnanensis]MCZ4278779.1 peptide transporter [Rhodococcus yunnanensis]
MAKGRRTSLAELASGVGDHSPVDQVQPSPESDFRPSVSLDQLIGNPHNPRESLGDLGDLRSIADRQLQPATAVTRGAWLHLYPEDDAELGPATYVVVNGCRRLAAAREYGRPGLDIVVRDSIAATRGDVTTAAVLENIARRDFDIIEEARAVELLTEELGSADAAAQRLSRTKGWVSQRRALLHLTPELQSALRAGELAVRDARTLARVPFEEQVAAWHASVDSGADDADSVVPKPPRPRTPVEPEKIVRALRRFKTDPRTLAHAVREYFSDDDLKTLLDELGLPR